MSVLKMKQDNHIQEYLEVFCDSSDELAARRAIGRALAALPDSEPPAGGWEALQSRLESNSGRRREPNWFLAGIGVAASVLLVVGLFVRLAGPEPEIATPVADVPVSVPDTRLDARVEDGAQVASLMRYSRQLEQRLRTVRARGGSRVQSGSEAAAVDEIERMIGVVDLQLAAAPTTPEEREALWRKRVTLMNQLLAAQVRPASMEL